MLHFRRLERAQVGRKQTATLSNLQVSLKTRTQEKISVNNGKPPPTQRKNILVLSFKFLCSVWRIHQPFWTRKWTLILCWLRIQQCLTRVVLTRNPSCLFTANLSFLYSERCTVNIHKQCTPNWWHFTNSACLTLICEMFVASLVCPILVGNLNCGLTFFTHNWTGYMKTRLQCNFANSILQISMKNETHPNCGKIFVVATLFCVFNNHTTLFVAFHLIYVIFANRVACLLKDQLQRHCPQLKISKICQT